MRPYHLSYAPECGVKGLVEPESRLMLRSLSHVRLFGFLLAKIMFQNNIHSIYIIICIFIVFIKKTSQLDMKTFSPPTSGLSPAIMPAHIMSWAFCQQVQRLFLASHHAITLRMLRFQSDPNLGGVEKLSISAMRPDIGMAPPHKISAQEVSEHYSGYVDPIGAFMVKGWTRSFCAMTVMLCGWQNPAFLEADGCLLFGTDSKHFVGRFSSTGMANRVEEEPGCCTHE